MPVPCSSSEDCSVGNVCKNFTCYPQCKLDVDCAFNEKCLRGNCQLTCRVDNDCFIGHICLNNMCFYGCHDDNDCTSSESCRNNKCINPCEEHPCAPNALCAVYNHRATCSCGKGFIPNPSAKIACVRTPVEYCRQNKDCPVGTACVDKLCRPLCSIDTGCVTNERCDKIAGICRPICRKDSDCRYNEICDGIACITGCRTDSNCPKDTSCIDNKCINPCLNPTACGTNANCSVIDHRKNCTCLKPLEGNPYESCRYLLKSCLRDLDCNNGLSCDNNNCQKKCRM